jgi:RecB family exonuclease
MTEEILHDRAAPVSNGPHLSFSRINRYLLCPEQYRLYYVENLRPAIPSANLVFGKLVHESLAALFRDGTDPAEHFSASWNVAKGEELDYSSKDSWEKLNTAGQSLLEKFVKEDLARLSNVRAAEEAFELNVTSLDVPLVGIIDLVADLDGKTTVVDFKTSASTYKPHEVRLSDQLTSYQLAHPDVRQSALCVLVKTKEPKIEWHVATRTGSQLLEFLSKAKIVAQEVSNERFYKRPGIWCTWCDYLPVCLGDEQKVKHGFVQIG